jgi:glyoxylase-like metal-dependent hydrolase (beta-lactamase superfamily II)
VHQVFQVAWPDGSTLLIDAGFPEAAMERMGGGGAFRGDGFEKVLAAMRTAEHIVVTHEHFDHLAGLGAYPDPGELAGRLHLTREQLANARAVEQAELPPELRALPALDYDRVLALAPGVVLVEAPGHTPGSQLVYVRTGDGGELLFVGDVAWHTDQLVRLHYRPRLVTDYFLGEDRAAVLAQFRALHDMMQAHPEVRVVVSHDREQRAQLLAAGAIREGIVP